MATPTSLPSSFSDNTVLTASQMNNLRGAFRVLQVVSVAYGVAAQNNTNVYANTGLSATITPSSTSNKILIITNQSGCGKLVGNAASHMYLRLLRGSTEISLLDSGGGYTNSSIDNLFGSIASAYLDSPSTTSATTYKTEFRNNVNANGVVVQVNSSVSTMTLMEISA